MSVDEAMNGPAEPSSSEEPYGAGAGRNRNGVGEEEYFRHKRAKGSEQQGPPSGSDLFVTRRTANGAADDGCMDVDAQAPGPESEDEGTQGGKADAEGQKRAVCRTKSTRSVLGRGRGRVEPEAEGEAARLLRTVDFAARVCLAILLSSQGADRFGEQWLWLETEC